ncbi:hypothetical protein Hanom_Chr11g01031371 [Helianthus anomalus]
MNIFIINVVINTKNRLVFSPSFVYLYIPLLYLIVNIHINERAIFFSLHLFLLLFTIRLVGRCFTTKFN